MIGEPIEHPMDTEETISEDGDEATEEREVRIPRSPESPRSKSKNIEHAATYQSAPGARSAWRAGSEILLAGASSTTTASPASGWITSFKRTPVRRRP